MIAPAPGATERVHVGRISTVVPLDHATAIGEARRRAAEFAAAAGFDEPRAGAVAIAVTEAAGNVLRHAGRGTLVLGAGTESLPGVEVLALDAGPGIADVAHSMRDGTSTAGTPGTGLGAMQRLADAFDLYTRPGAGTVVRLWFAGTGRSDAGRAPRDGAVGGLCVPKTGETACGDGWAMRLGAARLDLLVADGLGHGPDAALAARAAIDAFVLATPWPGGEDWLVDAHSALRRTRGAALGVAELDAAAGAVRFTGVGNVAAVVVVDAMHARHLVSQNGIVGHTLRKVQSFRESAGAGALLVLHTDGLSARWNLGSHPGLAARHPSVVAAVLWRDHSRGNDDATVVVARVGSAGHR
jgi:anti-sigma regulatory factor (Ser/Thr protein kinase)